MPIGTRSRSAADRAAHSGRGSKLATSSMPSSLATSKSVASGSEISVVAPSRNGETIRAQALACSTLSSSPRPSAVRASLPDRLAWTISSVCPA